MIQNSVKIVGGKQRQRQHLRSLPASKGHTQKSVPRTPAAAFNLHSFYDFFLQRQQHGPVCNSGIHFLQRRRLCTSPPPCSSDGQPGQGSPLLFIPTGEWSGNTRVVCVYTAAVIQRTCNGLQYLKGNRSCTVLVVPQIKLSF